LRRIEPRKESAVRGVDRRDDDERLSGPYKRRTVGCKRERVLRCMGMKIMGKRGKDDICVWRGQNEEMGEEERRGE